MLDAASQGARPQGLLEQKWAALHASAEQVARLGELSNERAETDVDVFAQLLVTANDWQRDVAWQGVEDIEALMRAGLAALGTVAARGQDASVPARALWREFHYAREAVLCLLQPICEARAA